MLQASHISETSQHLPRVGFLNVSFQNVSFQNVSFLNVSFLNVSFLNVSFLNVSFQETNFVQKHNHEIIQVTFIECYLIYLLNIQKLLYNPNPSQTLP